MLLLLANIVIQLKTPWHNKSSKNGLWGFMNIIVNKTTTAIACINTNRNYIGFELNKEYYEIAKNRINKHILDNNLQNKYKGVVYVHHFYW